MNYCTSNYNIYFIKHKLKKKKIKICEFSILCIDKSIQNMLFNILNLFEYKIKYRSYNILMQRIIKRIFGLYQQLARLYIMFKLFK